MPEAHEPERAFLDDFLPKWKAWLDRNHCPEKTSESFVRLLEWEDAGRPFEKEDRPSFSTDKTVQSEYNAISAILNVCSVAERLAQAHFYFRRYPFDKNQITKYEHFSNMCEFYFSQFYTLRCRLKEVLNKLREVYPNLSDIAKTLKAFDRTFDAELRERNGATHHRSYSDMGLDYLTVTGLISERSKAGVEWSANYELSYRKLQRAWSKQAQVRGGVAKEFVYVVVGEPVRNAGFLRFGAQAPRESDL